MPLHTLFFLLNRSIISIEFKKIHTTGLCTYLYYHKNLQTAVLKIPTHAPYITPTSTQHTYIQTSQIYSAQLNTFKCVSQACGLYMG